eukprot:TRINITY_DN9671_c0_g1_i4.p1 TRINITY_DN9671_c0_g1~~TRINITY_DN9671_c0_g1_i4.p1  ORF type:complete len:587 (+),score=205.02 TRINITY_DN9671_c0_g1_i4:41-1801(+)
MSARPKTGMRLGTGRAGTAARRMGTGNRMGTARLGTGRLGTAARAASGTAINTQVSVTNRPMTMQGLGGTARIGTQSQGRQVMDETYFLSALRAKSAELTSEIKNMNDAIAKLERDHASYTTYEQKAEKSAAEIKVLQGQLADVNLLADHLRTNTDIQQVIEEKLEVKAQNDRLAELVDSTFTERQTVEKQVAAVKAEIEAETEAASNLTEQMDQEQLSAYQRLTADSGQYKEQVEIQQTQLQSLDKTVEGMEKELASNPLKREAVALMDQLSSLRSKLSALQEQAAREAELSPEQQRERLLDQVKADNQEIAAMERKINEAQQSISRISSALADLDSEDVDADEEKRQKYNQLVKHDAEMTGFLDTFASTMQTEEATLSASEAHVQELLESISRALSHSQQLPSSEEHSSLQDDLSFKTKEMERSKETAQSLKSKREHLARDLRNVEHLEDKIAQEMEELKQRLAEMKTELETYKNKDSLSVKTEETKQALAQERRRLLVRKEAMKKVMQELASTYDKLNAKLKESETFIQLGNLEKKWQHYEKNNFVMTDFIRSKTKEADYSSIADEVRTDMKAIHDILQQRYI